MNDYDYSYPTEPSSGGNPYYRCIFCKRTDPVINGSIYGHAEDCKWRQKKLQDKNVNDVAALLKMMREDQATVSYHDLIDEMLSKIDAVRPTIGELNGWE